MKGYLDHNATSPLDPEVLDAMAAAAHAFGNPSSVHRFGAEARLILERSRRQIARALNAGEPENLIFTGSATEANNLAIKGFALTHRAAKPKPMLACSPAEHRAVLDPIRQARDQGLAVTHELEVDEFGRVSRLAIPLQLHQPALISVMYANNEVGTINPVPRLAAQHGDHLVHFHCDAVQALGRIPLNIEELGVDMVTIAPHKAGGPKGIGALWIRPGLALEPLISGGGQERATRAGTENPALVAGFAKAAMLAAERVRADLVRMSRLREGLWDQLRERVPGILRNSPERDCLPNTLNVSLPTLSSQEAVRALDHAGFAVSAGSACASGGGEEPSHVLLAMGLGVERASRALRISLGPTTTSEELNEFVAALEAILVTV